MSIEALKLAREVLQDYVDEYGPHEKDSGAAYTLMKLDQAIERRQKPEPVVCIGFWNQKTGAFYKPDQIAESHQKLIDDGILRRCYTSPPQRQWVGLTLDEIEWCFGDAEDEKVLTVINIERMLREKNT